MQIDGVFLLELGLGKFYSALMTSLIQYLIQYKMDARLQRNTKELFYQNENLFRAYGPVWTGFGTSESRGL